MHKIYLTLFLVLILSACNQRTSSETPIFSSADNIKSSCGVPQKLPDDIEKQTCIYHTNSLPLAYQQVVKEVNIRQGKTTKLRAELPLKNVEDNFENEQLWITFNWKNKAEVLVTVTSEGEETEYLIKKLKDKVEVDRTLALQ